MLICPGYQEILEDPGLVDWQKQSQWVPWFQRRFVKQLEDSPERLCLGKRNRFPIKVKACFGSRTLDVGERIGCWSGGLSVVDVATALSPGSLARLAELKHCQCLPPNLGPKIWSRDAASSP